MAMITMTINKRKATSHKLWPTRDPFLYSKNLATNLACKQKEGCRSLLQLLRVWGKQKGTQLSLTLHLTVKDEWRKNQSQRAGTRRECMKMGWERLLSGSDTAQASENPLLHQPACALGNKHPPCQATSLALTYPYC